MLERDREALEAIQRNGPIKKIPDKSPMTMEIRQIFRKVNELVDRTNENTQRIAGLTKNV